ncbi:MAG: phosphoribosylformylglycinamidine synthase II, partial [Abditibacteriota bacterium]|nr:phosphoribosylformylglycinamidine synthase II [Abditibacteriota bacterium]
YEIMLSESQERMLAVIEKGHEEDVAKVFRKWGLAAVVIGTVTDDGIVRIYDKGELVACVPAKTLADDAPTYYLETKEPGYISEVQTRDLAPYSECEDIDAAFMKIIGSLSISSKEWVYSQYDHMVQTNTCILPGSDAAMLRIRGTKKAVAVVTDCNGRYVYLNPYKGAQIAVAEAARNISVSGALPNGVTDCLNFGNPEKPEAFWQFEQAVKGLALACEAFNAPVISGNVSFYNETPEGTIFPTPTIGMCGLLEDVDKRMTSEFKNSGDDIYLLCGTPLDTEGYDSLGGSEYLNTVKGVTAGDAPYFDMDDELRVQKCIRELIDLGLVSGTHDVSDGGLAVCLAESCINSKGKGAEIAFTSSSKPACALFAEGQSRIVVSLAPANAEKAGGICGKAGVGFMKLGKVTDAPRFTVSLNGSVVIDRSMADIIRAYRRAIPDYMD